MLGHSPFYHSTIRKAISAFAKIFLDIYVVRSFEDKTEERRIKVPLTYGPKEKYLYRTTQDPELSQQVRMIFPRMSFQLISMNYIAERKNLQTNKIRKVDESGTINEYTYSPVPYMLNLSLSIITRTQDDVNQIAEQILPFFKPEYTVSINAIPELEIKNDVPIVLTGINMSNEYDTDWNQTRNLIWELTFQMPINFFGPIQNTKIIKHTQIDFLIPPSDGPVTNEQVEKTPRSLRIQSIIDPFDATSEEDYDILTTIEYFDDGLKFNPKTLQDEEIPE